jgi:heterodisulfide reductase subunit C
VHVAAPPSCHRCNHRCARVRVSRDCIVYARTRRTTNVPEALSAYSNVRFQPILLH